MSFSWRLNSKQVEIKSRNKYPKLIYFHKSCALNQGYETFGCCLIDIDKTVVGRDSSWNINEYITKLHKSLKTWKKVYWHLWGDVHFLFCLTCKRHFPANQISWCRYHPDTPQFFTLDAQKAPLPIGRFPCCGERAYRFQLLEDFSGCQFRQHMVTLR